jgi:hypothetical protein
LFCQLFGALVLALVLFFLLLLGLMMVEMLLRSSADIPLKYNAF